MSGDNLETVKRKQQLLFGPVRDFYSSELSNRVDESGDVGGEVINRILLNPDIVEDSLPNPSEWRNASFVPDKKNASKRYYNLRDSVIDIQASAKLARNLSRPGPPLLVYRREASIYGLSQRQWMLSAQMMLSTIDQSVAAGESMLRRSFGGFYVPLLADFKRVMNTENKSLASLTSAGITVQGYREDGYEPSEIEKEAIRKRLEAVNKEIETGAFGAVYRGLPYGDYAWNRSVAIRVQRIRPSSLINEGKRNEWMLDARLMLYACHVFDEYRLSKPELNNFCPAFYSGRIGIGASKDPASIELVTVHAYWDGTLDKAILFDGSTEPLIKIRSAANPVDKQSLVLAEIERIWRVLKSLERFAVGMLALGDGSIGKSLIVHGDLKMNNVVVAGPSYVMGAIDFGMTAFYGLNESNKGEPPQRTMRSEIFRYNTPNRFDGFLDFAYLRYTTRVQLLLWAEQMYRVTQGTPIFSSVKDEMRKVVMHIPFLSVLSLDLYHYYLDEHASKVERRWIYPPGVAMKGHDVLTPFSVLTGIQTARNGFYECEFDLVNFLRPMNSGTMTLVRDEKERWVRYKRILESRKNGML